MSGPHELAHVAALLGDPARSRMLVMLMAGQARTAGELALDGGVSPSTASSHLSRLLKAGLVEVAQQGRHRYFRLAGPEVARAIEALMGAVPDRPVRRAGPADPGLRRARVCYDHLAGELAVAWLQAMREHGHLAGADGLELTATGEAWCRQAGFDLEVMRSARRPLCRACLDWSERRDHLAGALGAALLRKLLEGGRARRLPDSRVLQVDARGERWLTTLR
ncbi:MAG: helix-turn-helix transcriptional regulator [Pseudoxanthomonas sp.]|nr:helix-turn-helix transcriptional regulator [Pseudoxanthomonas sp.]